MRLLPLPTDEDERPVVRFRLDTDAEDERAGDAPPLMLLVSGEPSPRGRILRRRLLPERLVSSAVPASVPLAQKAWR